MSKHLQRDLNQLKRQLLEVGSLDEEGTNKAIVALTEIIRLSRPELSVPSLDRPRAAANSRCRGAARIRCRGRALRLWAPQ